MTDENKLQDESGDNKGIEAGGALGKIRLPAVIANAVAPACVWLVYSAAATLIFNGVCMGIATIIEALK